jgi:hypothetical protein
MSDKKIIIKGVLQHFSQGTKNRPYHIDNYLFKINIIRKNKINKIFCL